MTSVPKNSPPSGKATHWARIEERGVFAGLSFMLWVYRVLGRRCFSLLLYPVITYFFIAGGDARRASRDFLSRVYNSPGGRDSFDAAPDWRKTFRHLFAFGDAILDKLAAWTGDITDSDIRYHNRGIFDALRHENRGALLVASHLGNMEVCRALGELSLGLKLNVLVHTRHAAKFNRLLKRASPQSAVSLIQTTEVDPGTAIMLQERIAQGEFVIIVGDRIPVTESGRISWVSFFGAQAPFPQGPYILASLLKCPVQLIFCLKRSDGYHIVFEPFADEIRAPRRERNTVLEGWAVKYAARLEHYCASDPYQWFNFFDFWGQAEKMADDGGQEETPKD